MKKLCENCTYWYGFDPFLRKCHKLIQAEFDNHVIISDEPPSLGDNHLFTSPDFGCIKFYHRDT